MSWNYRVVIKRDDSNNEHYGIHEVYYDDEGRSCDCTTTPCDPYGDTLQDLKDSVVQMLGAFLEPTLEYDDIGKYSNRNEEVLEVVNELYRTSYLDHYAKKKIVEAIEK